MHLIEILHPLNDNSGKPFAREKYANTRKLLTDRFAGVMTSLAPAHGTTSSGTVRDKRHAAVTRVRNRRLCAFVDAEALAPPVDLYSDKIG
jgi:hypothetical protein